jgi:uncharacterized protein YbaR (Trm112 family)
MIKPELLQILCCPETHQKLSIADAALISRINDAIASGRLTNRVGQNVSEKIDSALVREDGKFAYLIRGNIPVMLIDEAIPLPV